MQTTITGLPRPRFHLTPERNWMNDPNGLVFHDGRWHAYFQHNPEGSDWGNMSWGHASSTDLLRWDEHPVALLHRADEQVYSGSVVVGPDDGQLTAFYTSAFSDGRQAQSRAVSRDGGFTWERDADNPVLDRGTSSFRDPKVIRYTAPDGDVRWIMLAVEADDRQVLFFSSSDLRTWEHVSTFGPIGVTGVVWECPDLVPLAVDGREDEVRWVLLLSTNPVGSDADPEGSSMSFVVGRFDGTVFTAEGSTLRRLDHGRDFYAGVTFDSAPDGAAVMLGWMSNWRYAADVPSSPWRGAMSLPRRLSLRTGDDDHAHGGLQLVQSPPPFVTERLAAAPSAVIDEEGPHEFTLSGYSLVDLRWDPSSTGRLHLVMEGTADARVEIIHDVDSSALGISRSGVDAAAVHPDFPSTTTARLAADRPARLLLSLDGPLLEVFVGDGEATVSNLVLLGINTVSMTLRTERPGPVAVAAIELSPADEDRLGR